MITADSSKELNRRLMDLVDRALKEKGLSAREVSMAVVGHDGLVRDIRAGRTPSYDRVRALLEYLDIDLYLRSGLTGPREDPVGFAETAIERIEKSVDGSPEALRQGYLPIPFNRSDPSHRGAAPIAFARAWLAEEGLSPENLSIVGMPSDDMAPYVAQGELLLINEACKLDSDVALSAFVLDGKLGLGWACAPNSGALVIMFEGRFSAPVVLDQKRQSRYRHLGGVAGRFSHLANLRLRNADKIEARKRISMLVSGDV